MKRNIVTATAEALFDQLMVVKNANTAEAQEERDRLASMSQGAEQIARLAETEVKLIIGANIIPQNSLLVVGIQEIVDKPKQHKGLLTEEFTRPAK